MAPSVVSDQVGRLRKVDFGDPKATRTAGSANNVADKLAEIKTHRMSHDTIKSAGQNISYNELSARPSCQISAQTNGEWTIEP